MDRFEVHLNGGTSTIFQDLHSSMDRFEVVLKKTSDNQHVDLHSSMDRFEVSFATSKTSNVYPFTFQYG